MKCEKCGDTITQGEERELRGQILCEDCYLDRLAPVLPCDPWAVYSAQTSLKGAGADFELTETQARVLKLLEETGGAEPEAIAEKLGIKLSDIERDIATLRHMEKIRGELRNGRKVIGLWPQMKKN